MVGLSSGPPTTSYAGIEYAIYRYFNGSIYVFENGSNMHYSFASYSPSDIFTVRKLGDTVTYLRNGEVFYTSAQAAVGRFALEARMASPGDTISQVRIAGAVDAQTPVAWTSPVGVTVQGDNSIVRGTQPDGWTAGAASTQNLAGDGELSFRFANNSAWAMAGIDSSVGGTSYGELDFAIYQRATWIEIYENGAQICASNGCGFSAFSTSDVWTIRRVGAQVQYLRNGEVFHTSAKQTAGPYIADTTLHSPGATITDVTIANSFNRTSRNVYDVAGSRIMRTEPDGSKTLYLGSTELRWDAATSSMQAARYYPTGTMRTFDGDLLHTNTNHQGSVTTTMNATTGAVERTTYLPYGAAMVGTSANDKGFLGQTDDPDQALVYLNNRHYDPTTGIFISVDPLVTMTGQPYIYGAANPVTYFDPDGLQPCANSACPDGIPVVQNGKADHRAWRWTRLVESVGRGRARQVFEDDRSNSPLPSWGLPGNAEGSTKRHYSYTYEVSESVAPEQMADFFVDNCQYVFPIRGCGLGFEEGDKLDLYQEFGARGHQSFPVEVSEISDAVVRFTSLEGHPEGVGRQISFRFVLFEGATYLKVDAWGPGSVLTKFPIASDINYMLAERAWASLADNLRSSWSR